MNHEHLELLVTRVMPFGKHNGWLIADLPSRYRQLKLTSEAGN